MTRPEPTRPSGIDVQAHEPEELARIRELLSVGGAPVLEEIDRLLSELLSSVREAQPA